MIEVDALVEYSNSSNLEILNQGTEPTFCSGCKLEVIDITLVSFGLLESITSWEVSSNPPYRTTDVFCSLYRAPNRYV
jgi:hypothetical protein